MRIDELLCTRCGECVPFCTVGAIISTPNGKIGVVQDECVECGACLRSGVCPTGALVKDELRWPRVLRARFSDPQTPWPDKSVGKRGTPGVKTNDVTGILKPGKIGIAIEMGRPNIGVRLREVERVARAVAVLKPTFKVGNPVTVLMTDSTIGKMREDVLDEKVLSANLELTIEPELLEKLVDILRPLSQELQTVFSLSLSCVADEDGTAPLVRWAAQAGLGLNPNGKLNVGLGKI